MNMQRRLVLLVLTALMCLMPMAAFGQAADPEAGAVLTVTGAGRVSVAPDMATVSLGVQVREDTVAAAQAGVNAQMSAVLDAVRGQGVDEKDISTDYLSIYPDYNYTDAGAVLNGYSATNTVSITVRDLRVVGAVIDAAANAGANQLNGVSLGLLDDSEAYKQALALAVADAADKAQVLAQASGHALGAIRTVSESYGYSASPMARSAEMALADSEAGGGTEISQGQMSVTARIAVEYDIIK